MYRSGAASAESVIGERLAAITADRTIRAVVDLDVEGALASARALDTALDAGEPLGPLHGLPVTVKASFAVAGATVSVGIPDTAVRAEVDAPAVARLRAAGAVILGSSNVPPMLDGFHSDSPLGGRTVNPRDPSRTPGGSSGGAGAAIAAGFSDGDIGSDLGGSIRVPAAFCGVVGHRPSQFAVSKRGHLPWPLDALVEPPLSAAGPMARTVADVQQLFEVLLRVDPEATGIAPVTLAELRGLRVGVWRDEPGAECDPEVDAVLDCFVAALADAGCVLVPLSGTVLGRPQSADLFDRLVAVELAFTSDGGASIGQVWADWEAQRGVRAEWAATVADVDIVIAPAVPVVAPLHDEVQADAELRRRITRWSAMTNLAAVPCTVLPVGLDPVHGMPVAVQVIAPFGRDRDALVMARALQDAGLAPALAPGSVLLS
ncbi:amidase [Amnibacterium kyonggiense]|uniref:amidase n=1 Tax=Amnibacterium kyonggiense TaxID=595671 RepID=UPI0013C2D3F2|nr:amidase [Amnibacterium kyonggiense]